MNSEPRELKERGEMCIKGNIVEKLVSVSPALSLLLSVSLFHSPHSLMEHVFLCLPCSYAWDGKGAQPGNCVMFTVPSAIFVEREIVANIITSYISLNITEVRSKYSPAS